MGGWRRCEGRMGMPGKVLQFGGGEVAMQGVEIGEKGMREEEGKTMGRCSTSGGVIITKCEFHVFRKTKTFTSSSQRICQLVHLVTLRLRCLDGTFEWSNEGCFKTLGGDDNGFPSKGGLACYSTLFLNCCFNTSNKFGRIEIRN